MTGEVILYQTEDGAAQISLRAMDGTVWLTQAEMAALFDTAPQAITQLIKTVYADGELTAEATCKEFALNKAFTPVLRAHSVGAVGFSGWIARR